MYKAGYHNIWNIDYSENVITMMRERCQSMNKMVWDVMDVTDIKYEDNFFDIAIDKSTIDALLCGDNAFLNVAMMTKEV